VVHDEIHTRIRNDKLEEVLPQIDKIMMRTKLMDRLKIHFKVPIVAEHKLGCWSKGKTWHIEA